MAVEPGDRVKVMTSDAVFEGMLLPRPELLSDDITVVKLKSGYNVGIASGKIKKVEMLQKHKPVSKKKRVLKKEKGLPTVAVLSTGGTISSKIDYRTGGVYADYTAEDFVAMCPELQGIANINAKKVLEVMSEDMLPKDWVGLAKEVVSVLKDVDGVVITHGTDTLHFTAAALSFLVKDLNKPVVLTGAQRSIDRGSSDAFMNLICAVTVAAKWDGAGVVVCMHGSMDDSFCDLIRGTKVRKMHASRRDAFRAVNDEPLARVFGDGRVELADGVYCRRSGSVPSVRLLDKRVALVFVHPGMDPGVVDYHVKSGVKGLVVAATALGHVPTNCVNSLIPSLKNASKSIPVFVTSQTLYGRVNPFVYANLRRLSLDVGAVFLADMLPEVAYVKLMVALKQEDPVKFMLQDIAGELTAREVDDCFLR